MSLKRMSMMLHGMVFGVVLLAQSGIAAAVDTPASLDGVEIVDTDKAKSLMDSGVMMVDARVAGEYVEAHIKGAVSIPYKEKSAKSADFDPTKDRFDLSKLPSDKNTPFITQCNGASCWKSYKAAVVAAKAGYSKVYWYRDGLPAWKAKGYPIE